MSKYKFNEIKKYQINLFFLEIHYLSIFIFYSLLIIKTRNVKFSFKDFVIIRF
jgi:hypothetical protein